MDAQVVYERQSGGDLQGGPCDFVQVGMRFGDRVFWIASAWFPGSEPRHFERGETLAKEIVQLCTADHAAGERKLRGRLATMLNAMVLDRERNPGHNWLFDPYIDLLGDMFVPV